MIPAARSNTTPDARALPGRSSSDGTPRDVGFDAAMADVAHGGSDAASTKAVPAASTPAQPGNAQAIAALLAKLASGAPPTAADGKDATGGDGDASTGDASTTAKSDKTSDDAGPATQAKPDPLAAMAALLPGLAAAPTTAAAAATPKMPSDPAKLASPLKMSLATAADVSRDQGNATSADGAAAAEHALGFTIVASSTHLAPAAPPDAGPIAAVASHTEPGASLPDGTLQSIANAVTALAADVAAAPSEAAPSAAATVPDPTPVSASPARSLTLQLNPGELGSVTVRLHLTADGLDVNLAVDDRKTLASISHARDELSAAIGDNGYRVESLVIRGSDASSTSTAGSNDSARSQSEAGAGQGFSGGGSGGSGGDAPSSRQRTAPASAGARDRDLDRGGDGVFV